MTRLPPIVPLPGYNTQHLTRIATTCCACFSRDTKRTRMGTYYCDPCLASAREFMERVREREGEAAVRGWMP